MHHRHFSYERTTCKSQFVFVIIILKCHYVTHWNLIFFTNSTSNQYTDFPHMLRCMINPIKCETMTMMGPIVHSIFHNSILNSLIGCWISSWYWQCSENWGFKWFPCTRLFVSIIFCSQCLASTFLYCLQMFCCSYYYHLHISTWTMRLCLSCCSWKCNSSCSICYLCPS